MPATSVSYVSSLWGLKTQDHMQLEISKCYFPHNLYLSPSKRYENIGHHGKSKCLLEYCKEKLASST